MSVVVFVMTVDAANAVPMYRDRMWFNSLDPIQNGQQFAAALASELRVPVHVIGLQTFAQPAAEAAPGIAGALSHMLTWAPQGSAPYIQALVAQLAHPGPWGATLHVVRTAASFIVGARLVFAAHLRGSIAQSTHLQPGGSFAGDPRVAASLNADGALLQGLRRQRRTSLRVGDRKLTLPNFSGLVRQEGGVVFTLGTMPEVSLLGKATLHARSFLDLAGRVQWHLDACAPAAR
jgi:hypothetical protein